MYNKMGILFYDRINDSPYKYTGQIVETTNPCLDKDTLLWDGDRYVKISENPKTFKSWKTGEKETIRLYTNIGYQIILTPDHKIMLADGSFIEAKDSLGKEIMWKGDRGPELAVTISGIKPMGIREVWDFSNEVHYNTANGGFVVHNCGEEPMPPGGSCDLGSIDFSKFLTPEGEIDFELLDIASRYTVRFLDSVLDKNSFPTEDSRIWAERNRAVGVGGMGYADLLLMLKIPYGSQEAIDVLESIMKVMEFATEDESIKLGQEKGVPEECKKLPVPRRNIVLRTFAPTGTCSILAGCSNSLEPIFSEVTVRNDKTGTYTLVNNLAEQPYFRCAVSANGAQEVTVEEHIKTLALAQRYVDSGVSKTINAPTTIKRDAIAKAIFMAWQEGCKGITLYRNGSRKKEVLTPKNIKKGKCPVCGSDLIEINGKMKCLSCKKDFDENGKEFSYN
jgi:ribonucleotide reductase alpha subunit